MAERCAFTYLVAKGRNIVVSLEVVAGLLHRVIPGRQEKPVCRHVD